MVDRETASQPPRLTPRERDVLVALCQPLVASGDAFTEPASIRQVADALFVSEAAVQQHLARLYDKFEIYDDTARRRVQLANAAMDRGAITRAELLGDEPNGSAVANEATETLVTRARDSAAARDWVTACELLTAAEANGAALDPPALEVLGEAAMFSDRHAESVDARQRAHAAYLADGDRRGAARVALGLAINHAARIAFSVAGGWLNTARRLLDGDEGAPEYGYLLATTALFELLGGDPGAGRVHAQEVFEFGTRVGDANLKALGLAIQGLALTRLGDVDDGLALLDEAMTGALTGALGPLALGLVYCRTVCACIDVFDYRRAQEWIEVIERSSVSVGSVGFPGDCRAHKAAVLIARGDWTTGMTEALSACEESERFDLAHTGLATYSMAELYLRRGALDDAEEWFHRAHELGASPQPGLALVWLARGDGAGAHSAIATALHEAGPDLLVRARLLPTVVDAAIASGRFEEARAGASELSLIADRYRAAALRAASSESLGSVRLAAGDAAAAVVHLAHARRLWRDGELPYESARTGVRLANAHVALGDVPGACLELEAAQRQFERLGAEPDARRAGELRSSISG